LAGAEGARFVGEVAGDFESSEEGLGGALGGEDGRALGVEAGDDRGGGGVELIVGGGGHGGEDNGVCLGCQGVCLGGGEIDGNLWNKGTYGCGAMNRP
jgi:hypothetical protein